jgi:hypothetical protein
MIIVSPTDPRVMLREGWIDDANLTGIPRASVSDKDRIMKSVSYRILFMFILVSQ